MKKLMILGIVAGAFAIFGTTKTAKADHTCYGGSYYGGYSYVPRSYYYGGPSYNYFYSARPRSGFSYYSPGFRLSIGSGFRGGYGYRSGFGYRGHRHHHHHHHHH